VAAGAREALIPDVEPGRPHQLRVEAAGRPPVERTFVVAAGATVELAVETAPPAPPPPAGPASFARPAPRPAAARPHPHEKPAAAPPGPAAAHPRHRDGLVGDDIFDGH
jgi:hypothetical protein